MLLRFKPLVLVSLKTLSSSVFLIHTAPDAATPSRARIPKAGCHSHSHQMWSPQVLCVTAPSDRLDRQVYVAFLDYM